MDKLFVLPSKFKNKKEGNHTFFCADCALIQGFLNYFPEVKEHVVVKEVPYPRPRKAILDILGEEHQSCPVLVLDDAELDLFPGISIHQVGGVHFIDEPIDITRYLGAKHKVSLPH